VRAGIGRGADGAQVEKELDLSKHVPWGQDPARNQASVRAVYSKLSKR
jgi:hypothetical protein